MTCFPDNNRTQPFASGRPASHPRSCRSRTAPTRPTGSGCGGGEGSRGSWTSDREPAQRHRIYEAVHVITTEGPGIYSAATSSGARWSIWTASRSATNRQREPRRDEKKRSSARPGPRGTAAKKKRFPEYGSIGAKVACMKTIDPGRAGEREVARHEGPPCATPWLPPGPKSTDSPEVVGPVFPTFSGHGLPST